MLPSNRERAQMVYNQCITSMHSTCVRWGLLLACQRDCRRQTLCQRQRIFPMAWRPRSKGLKADKHRICVGLLPADALATPTSQVYERIRFCLPPVLYAIQEHATWTRNLKQAARQVVQHWHCRRAPWNYRSHHADQHCLLKQRDCAALCAML